MRTTLSPDSLADLAAQGRKQADADAPLVDPRTANKSMDVLRQRGEEWAESVLMRRFTKRSIMRPEFPWLNHGEMETLVLAERAEWEQLARAAEIV